MTFSLCKQIVSQPTTRGAVFLEHTRASLAPYFILGVGTRVRTMQRLHHNINWHHRRVAQVQQHSRALGEGLYHHTPKFFFFFRENALSLCWGNVWTDGQI